MLARTRPFTSVVFLLAVLLALPGAQLALSAEPDGDPPGDARISASLELREQLGMRADESYVRELEASEDADRSWGAAMTADESAEMERRIRIQDSLGALDEYLTGLPEFGGLFIDQAAGAEINVALTADTLAIREGAVAAAPDGAAVRFRIVANSWSALQTAKAAIDAALLAPGREAHGIVSAVTNVYDNVVVVGVEGPLREAESYVGQFGASVVRVVPAEPGELLACNGWFDCAEDPWRGGLGIRSTTSPRLYDCTSAFIVRQSNGGAGRWLLTAGHCGPKFSNWEHSNNVAMGQITANTYVDGSASDAATMDTRDDWGGNTILIGDVINRSITSAQAQNADNYGDYTCHNGVATMTDIGGFVCGQLEWKDLTRCWINGTVCIFHIRRAVLRGAGGDSGGSVFSGNKALGIIHSGEVPSANGEYYTRVLYTHIFHIVDDIGGPNNTVVLQTAP